MANQWYKSHWTYIVLVIAVIIIYLIIPRAPAGEVDEFAACVTAAGATMFGTDWCPHCKAQKSLFGNSFSKIDYVNCDFNKDECAENGVQGYPTWKIDGQNYAGTQPLEKLAALTACAL